MVKISQFSITSGWRLTIVFLFACCPLLPLIAAAQAGGKPAIEARGHGEATAPADQAIINLTVESNGDSADEAVKATAITVAAINEAVKPYLTGKDDSIATTNLSINPRYTSYGQTSGRSYFATRRFTITIANGQLALIGELGQIAKNEDAIGFASLQDDSDPSKTRVLIDLRSIEPTPREAVEATERRSQKVKALIEAKVNGQGTIQTDDTVAQTSLGMASQTATPSVAGYVSRDLITIKLDEVNEVGSVADTAIKAGASRLDSVTFGLSSSTASQDQAIAAATRDAESKAQAQAAALHLRLGKLLKSSTVPFSSSVPPSVPAMGVPGTAAAGLTAPPLNPGEVTTSADVTLTYATE